MPRKRPLNLCTRMSCPQPETALGSARLSTAFALAINTIGSSGFMMQSSAPTSSPRKMSASLSRSVSMIIGTSENRRISRRTLRPSMSGRSTSSTTKLGSSESTASMPASPLEADNVHASGQVMPRVTSTNSTNSGSLSIISSFIFCPGHGYRGAQWRVYVSSSH